MLTLLLSVPPAAALDVCYPSGFHLRVEEDHRLPEVSVSTFIEGGTALPGASGAAHLLEHLWFRGDHGAQDRSTWFESIGATWNAQTTPDDTRFATEAHASFAGALLDDEAARMTAPLAGVDASDVASEEAIIGVEADLRGAGGRFVLDALAQRVFPAEHPYRRAWSNPTTAWTPDQLSALARSWWQPANTTLIVRGDVVADEIRARVEAHAAWGGGMAEARCLQRPTPVLEPSLADVDTPDLPGREDAVWLAWALPSRDVLPEIDLLTGAARSVAGLRSTCEVVPGRAASVLLCRRPVSEDASAERLVADIRERARASGMSGLEQRFASASAALRSKAGFGEWRTRSAFEFRLGADALSLLDSEARERFDELIHLGASRAPAEAYEHRLESLTSDSTIEALGRWIREEGMAAVITHRGKPDAAWPPGFGGGSASGSSAAPAPPIVQAAPRAIERFVLPNGLSVVLLPWGDTSAVRVGLAIPDTAARDPLPGLTALAWSAAVTDKEDLPWDTGAALSGIGTSMVGGSRVLGGTVPAEAADSTLASLAAWVAHLRADPERVDEATRGFASHLRQSATDHAWWAVTLLWAGVDASSPSGLATVDAWDTVGDSTVHDWLLRMVRPQSATLVVVGHIDTAHTRDVVKAGFGAWSPAAAAALPDLQAPSPAGPRRILVVDDPNRTLGRITLACPVGASARGSAEGAVLRELVRSAVFSHLRVERGLTYSPRIRLRRGRGDAMFLEAEVETPLVGVREGLETLFGAVAPIAAGSVDATRITGVQDRLAAGAVPDRWSLAGMAGWLLEDGDLAAGSEVTASQIAARAAACSGHEVVTVEGPTGEVDAALGDLPFERADVAAAEEDLVSGLRGYL